MSSIVILPINPGSDGDGRKWPKHHYVRNDNYFLERLATDKWIKDLPGGPQPGVIYRLDRLPQGYAGFERQRPDSKHTDRYIYGHPKGQFRSLNEFYPHFKHLMDHGDSLGCPCRHCVAGVNGGSVRAPASQRVAAPTTATTDAASTVFEDAFPQQQALLANQLIPAYKPDPSRRINGSSPLKRKLADLEGTADVYESLITQLKEAGPDFSAVDLSIEEQSSPDWWTGHASTMDCLKAWRDLPSYAPRIGEVVLFPRFPGDIEALKWDASSQTFRKVDPDSRAWLEQPEWMAGVVTQLPDEPISEHDLLDDSRKSRSVNYSGYRIEPLSDPSSSSNKKSWAKQPKYVPLHLIRPFSLLHECTSHLPSEKDWHPTLHHARKISSSFSVVGRHRFKGTWPHATVFAKGAYIGAELILPGDVVRLLPRPREQRGDAVTDVLVVSAIRLRFVNLDFDEDEEVCLPGVPYQVCLHFSGKVYTRDPGRSFDGVLRVAVDFEKKGEEEGEEGPGLAGIAGLQGHGPWYHYSDPANPDARIEIPFTRILSRCAGDSATKAWFTPPPKTFSAAAAARSSSFCAINALPNPAAASSTTSPEIFDLSRGLHAITEARDYSRREFHPIQQQRQLHQQSRWFWADTRIEQLDLHEVNDRSVQNGTLRSKGHLREWRDALRGLANARKLAVAGVAAAANAAASAIIGGGDGGGAKRGRPRKFPPTMGGGEASPLRPIMQGNGTLLEEEEDDEDDEDEGVKEEDSPAGADVMALDHSADDLKARNGAAGAMNDGPALPLLFPAASQASRVVDLDVSEEQEEEESEDEEERQANLLAEELAKQLRSGEHARM